MIVQINDSLITKLSPHSHRSTKEKSKDATPKSKSSPKSGALALEMEKSNMTELGPEILATEKDNSLIKVQSIQSSKFGNNEKHIVSFEKVLPLTQNQDMQGILVLAQGGLKSAMDPQVPLNKSKDKAGSTI